MQLTAQFGHGLPHPTREGNSLHSRRISWWAVLGEPFKCGQHTPKCLTAPDSGSNTFSIFAHFWEGLEALLGVSALDFREAGFFIGMSGFFFLCYVSSAAISTRDFVRDNDKKVSSLLPCSRPFTPRRSYFFLQYLQYTTVSHCTILIHSAPKWRHWA